MPEYLGPNSLAELAKLIDQDISKLEIPPESGETGPSEGDLTSYKFGHGLKVSEDKTVSVETTNNFNGDNTLPMTASGVETIVGNIETLLRMI